MARRAFPAVIALILGCTGAQAQTSAPAPPSIATVVREMPRDLWRFLSADTAVVISLGADAAVLAHTWDDDLADEVATNTTFNAAMEPGHTYGAFSLQAVVGVGLYAGGWFAKKERLARTGADVMRAQVLSQLYVQAIKYTAQRQRPNGSNRQSFPSGHSASAFATARVLQRHYGWKVGVPATAAAAYVATARVHDNRHYLSDVIFGAAMGIAAERTVMLHAGRYRVTVTPTTWRGRAAVLAGVDW